jgi:hypothetical protein
LYIDLTKNTYGLNANEREVSLLLHYQRRFLLRSRERSSILAREDIELADYDTLVDSAAWQPDSRILSSVLFTRHGFNRVVLAFYRHAWLVLSRNYVHVLLIFVPFGIFAGLLNWTPMAIFTLNMLALVPLATIIAESTEELPEKLGPKFGGLLEETFANAIEIIVRCFIYW